MWRRLLERLVPFMEDAPSTLDRLDGVGAFTAVTPPGRPDVGGVLDMGSRSHPRGAYRPPNTGA